MSGYDRITNKVIKLIYDKYENEVGFVNEDSLEKKYIVIDNIDNKPIKKICTAPSKNNPITKGATPAENVFQKNIL